MLLRLIRLHFLVKDAYKKATKYKDSLKIISQEKKYLQCKKEEYKLKFKPKTSRNK